jgi:uncharacterized protein (UPF0333 family)
MREILKIEKVNTVKALTASLIDLVITIVVGIALFYLAYLPIFKASTTYNESQNYIYSVEKVENSDTKLGYDLTLGDNLGYEKYVLEAKKFYEFYEDEFSNIEEHMNKLRELGYNVNRTEENSEVMYEISWKHAK